MRITYNPIDPTIDFNDLTEGEIFRYNDEGYFMKTRERGGAINDSNAVCLEDYSLVHFDDEEQIVPVDATLIIEGEKA